MNHKFVKKAIEAWQDGPDKILCKNVKWHHQRDLKPWECKKEMIAFWHVTEWILKCPDCGFLMLVPKEIITKHLNKFTELLRKENKC